MKKILLIVLPAILVIGAIFYWFLITPSADKQNTLSFLSENLHTGFVNAPLTQLALGGNPSNSNLAQGNSNSVNPAGPGGNVAMGNPAVGNPAVLFDISAQPLFGENGMSPQALLLIIFTIPILALFFLYLWDLLKKRGIER
jgi:preprotein translocase subunit YajC